MGEKEPHSRHPLDQEVYSKCVCVYVCVCSGVQDNFVNFRKQLCCRTHLRSVMSICIQVILLSLDKHGSKNTWEVSAL